MLGIGERTLYRKIQEWKKESEKTDGQAGAAAAASVLVDSAGSFRFIVANTS